jgi:hypothetical protein
VEAKRTEIIQERIDRILWGKSIVEATGSIEPAKTFVLRSLTSRETNLLDYIYKQEFDKALSNGMLIDNDLKAVYDREGLWTEYDDTVLIGLEKKQKILSDQVRQFVYMEIKSKKIKKELQRTKEEYLNKIKYRNSLFALTAEHWAEEIKRRHMLHMITQDLYENQYWQNTKEFMRETDDLLIFNLVVAYYANNVFDQKETREIARSGAWRYRWGASKNGADLFGKPIPEWSEAQSALVYWSQYYDFVFESSDKPSDSVIEDDHACDAWYDNQLKKFSSKGGEERNIVGTKKARTTKFHQEQFVMVDNREAAKRVQDQNTEEAKWQLKREQKKIERAKGRISEWDLRKNEYATGRM